MNDPEKAKVNIPAGPQTQPVNLSSESVAGEEDPGAALEMFSAAPKVRPADVPATNAGRIAALFTAPNGLNPGDEAAAGTPGTAEGICRDCGGSGQLSGASCIACGGTGKVTVGLAGG